MTSANPAPSPHFDSARQLLRHTLATLAYRGGKTLRGAPDGFSAFTCGGGCRSAGEILAHIGDLLDWGLSMVGGNGKWNATGPQSWNDDAKRFHAGLAAFDAYLASDKPLHAPIENLFQGPIADALTHVGQIAVLRRLAGSPVKGENYFLSDITAGRVGRDQAAANFEF
ncbi:MAG: hypothetical protein DMG60_12895 [Acidobacteria bacterium]|nr:MAG: hypothetical protein DMG60_12895 [Acidobacteriota bacterium]